MGFVQLSGIEVARVDVATGDLYVSGTRAEDEYVCTAKHAQWCDYCGVPTQYQFLNVPEGSYQFVITGGPSGLGGPAGVDLLMGDCRGTSGSDLFESMDPTGGCRCRSLVSVTRRAGWLPGEVSRWTMGRPHWDIPRHRGG